MKIKRILTVIFLVGIIGSFGYLEVNAKTTPRQKASSSATTKKSSSSKPFSAETLIQKGSYSNGFASNMEGTLKRMGFSENSNIFSKNGISIDFNDPLNLKVTFPSEVERDNFIESTKSMGYEWNGLQCINGKSLALDIAVDGNTVSIFFPE